MTGNPGARIRLTDGTDVWLSRADLEDLHRIDASIAKHFGWGERGCRVLASGRPETTAASADSALGLEEVRRALR